MNAQHRRRKRQAARTTAHAAVLVRCPVEQVSVAIPRKKFYQHRGRWLLGRRLEMDGAGAVRDDRSIIIGVTGAS
jgi:hypothetical protein